MATVQLSEIKEGQVFQFTSNDKQTFVCMQRSPAGLWVQYRNVKGRKIFDMNYNCGTWYKTVLVLEGDTPAGKTDHVYMTVREHGAAWDETKQTYLGVITWDAALKIARAQSNEVRLCHSQGYSNQGHYIQPQR
jgi:hypothetical protein